MGVCRGRAYRQILASEVDRHANTRYNHLLNDAVHRLGQIHDRAEA